MIDAPILVKDALREGSYKKNYRFLVLNDDGSTDFVIDNDTLVAESVAIDERLCTGSTLKFGLCEGTSMEFQYFNHPNITGRQIKAFIDIYHKPGTDQIETLTETNTTYVVNEAGTYTLVVPPYTSFTLTLTHDGETTEEEYFPTGNETRIVLEEYVPGDIIKTSTEYEGYTFSIALLFYFDGTFSIPMGYFTIKNCSRQASTGIIKASAYNKLQSDYLDQKANLIVQESLGSTTEIKIGALIRLMLSDYRIDNDRRYVEPVAPTVPSQTDAYLSSSQHFYLRTHYGQETPFNFYNYPAATLCKFAIHSRRGFFSDSEPLFFEFITGNFGVFERAFKDFIIAIIDKALFVDEHENPLTGEDIVNNWLRTGSWVNICAIRGANGTSVYSSLQWEWDQEHGTSHCAGTVNDALATLERGYFIMPFSYGIIPDGESASHLVYEKNYSFDGSTSGSYGVNMVYGTYRYIIGQNPDSSWILSDEVSVPLLEYYGIVYPTNMDIVGMWWKAYVVDDSGIDNTVVTLADLPDFTLRDFQSSVYETQCQFGQLDRETDLFSGHELNGSRLLPQDTLYPDNALYPGGGQISGFRSMYSKLWADEGNVHKWKYLIITYKGLDENQQEKEYTLQRTVNSDGTDNYNCSDNWLFRNLVWTAEQIGEYADAMVAKMRDITWFPFEMWCVGLPYIETGDEIEIRMGQNTYTSYVLSRKLKGIQNLQDTYINGTLDIF